jgi:hypothetical protein
MTVAAQTVAARTGAPQNGAAQVASPAVEVRAGLRVLGSGGVGLVTDLYLPDPSRRPAPVVVSRTPYDRAALRGHGLGWARYGFAFVAQDVRGRYGSEGTWQPYRGEREDGAALVGWVREQSWCSGAVVLSGASYGAFTAWQAALGADGPVAAVISEVPAVGTRIGRRDPSGVLRLTEHAGWWTEHAEARTSSTGLAQLMLREDPGVLHRLPVRDIGAHLWADVPGWWDAVADLAADTDLPVTGDEVLEDADLAGLAVPTLHVGGWYDTFAAQTLHQWRTAGSACTPRPVRSLVMGPWGHELSSPAASRVGEREHGPESRLPLGPWQAGWVRAVLDRTQRPSELVFSVGQGWTERWPATIERVVLHAHSDGSLAREEPTRTGRRQWWHDPDDPVPSVLAGHDRRALDDRDDVVRFRTAPSQSGWSLAGSVSVHLAVGTTAPDADWVVRLVERCLNGTAIELARGTRVAAAEVDRVRVVLTETAVTTAPGSCLELEVACSDFPWLARNLGTGVDRYTTTVRCRSQQTIELGPDRGTWVDLPVVTAHRGGVFDHGLLDHGPTPGGRS